MKRKPRYDTSFCIICASLFATFSFLYIYLFQGELLAFVQDYYSKGQTVNNTLITASLITLLLMALQYLLNRMGHLHGRYEACSYLPSCVVLALITKVDNTFSYSWTQWVVALLIVSVVYIFVVWIDRSTLRSYNAKFLEKLSPNLVVMISLFMFVGWYGNNNPADKMELAAWRYTHCGEYGKVLTVGHNSEECNPELTALRNLALAKTGQLGDKLFTFPQPYGADGLLMNRYSLQTLRYGAKEFYDLLGNCPYGGEEATSFYKRMWIQTDSVYYRDWYASALLLDKKSEDFVSLTVDRTLPAESLAHAPKHYQEAWIIYNEQHPFSPIAFVPDDEMEQRYREYLALRETYVENPVMMQNVCRRKFGKTYWYYYDFVGQDL